jgi:hypothetical protein
MPSEPFVAVIMPASRASLPRAVRRLRAPTCARWRAFALSDHRVDHSPVQERAGKVRAHRIEATLARLLEESAGAV